MGDDSSDILSDYRRYKTKFIPPLVDAMGSSLTGVRWQYESVPELLWIGTLFEEYEPINATEVTQECAKVAQELFGDDRNYVLSYDYDDLNEDDFQNMRRNLNDDTLAMLNDALAPISYYYPTFPQTDLIEESGEFEDDQLEKLQLLVDELSKRRSREAMLVQGTYVYALMETGGLKIAEEAAESFALNSLFDYPYTEESKKVAASVRASMKALRVSEDKSKQSEWAKRFWERGFEISECILPEQLEDVEDKQENPDDEFYEELVSLGLDYEDDLRETILDLWWNAEGDPEFTGKHSVLDGLLIRQVNLTTNLATSPSLWYPETTGIMLRCLSEACITLEWFNQEGNQEDYESFIEYGLGQEKLYLEHAFETLEEKDAPDELKQGFNDLEHRLNEQKYTYLIPVDVGSWNKDTRTMAQEAGCKDIYDLRFSLHSSTVHGMWNAIEKQSLTKCINPLHSYHRIPEFRRPALIPFAVVEAGNLMERSLVSWAEARGIDLTDSDVEIVDLAECAKAIIREYEREGILENLGISTEDSI